MAASAKIDTIDQGHVREIIKGNLQLTEGIEEDQEALLSEKTVKKMLEKGKILEIDITKKHSKRDRGDKRKRRSNSKDSDNNNSSHAHRKSHRDKEDPKLNLQKNKSVIDDEELGKMFNDLEDNSHPKHKEIDNSEQDKNSYNEKSRSMKSNNDSRNKSASRDKEDNKDYNRKDSKRKRNKKRRHHKKRSEDKNSYNDQQNIESDNIDKSDGENDGDNDEKPGRKIDLRSILLKPAKNNTIYERIKKR